MSTKTDAFNPYICEECGQTGGPSVGGRDVYFLHNTGLEACDPRDVARHIIDTKVSNGELIRTADGGLVKATEYDPAVHGRIVPDEVAALHNALAALHDALTAYSEGRAWAAPLVEDVREAVHEFADLLGIDPTCDCGCGRGVLPGDTISVWHLQ